MSESQNVEWKESWRDEYLKWVCGFANAQGGVLEIGRNDRGVVVGVKDVLRLLEEIPNKAQALLGIAHGAGASRGGSLDASERHAMSAVVALPNWTPHGVLPPISSVPTSSNCRSPYLLDGRAAFHGRREPALRTPPAVTGGKGRGR